MQVIRQQEVWSGIMTELGLRPTNVQYNGRSFDSSCNTFYNRNTATIQINKTMVAVMTQVAIHFIIEIL